MASDILTHLRALTPRLPSVPFASLSPAHTRAPVVSVTMDEGSCKMVGLYQQPELSVALATLTAGARVASHYHKETEYLLVISGRMIVHRGDCVDDMQVGKILVLVPGEVHWAEFPSDSRILAVTIPQSRGYPDA